MENIENCTTASLLALEATCMSRLMKNFFIQNGMYMYHFNTITLAVIKDYIEVFEGCFSLLERGGGTCP